MIELLTEKETIELLRILGPVETFEDCPLARKFKRRIESFEDHAEPGPSEMKALNCGSCGSWLGCDRTL